MRRVFVLVLGSALTLAPAPLRAQLEGARASYEAGTMGRLGDCIGDGMLVGAATGLVVGMFRTERTGLRVPTMLMWGVYGTGAGVYGGFGYWAVHELRRGRAMKRERPDTITTPGPRAQARILRSRPCRGTLPFTSGPATTAWLEQQGERLRAASLAPAKRTLSH